MWSPRDLSDTVGGEPQTSRNLEGNPMALFQCKDCLSRFRGAYYKGKTVVTLSYFNNGNSYSGKPEYLYWNSLHDTRVQSSFTLSLIVSWFNSAQYKIVY